MTDLAAILRTAAATEDDVLTYLQERSQQITDAGGVATPLYIYWQAGDLDRYRAAAAVWAKDAPPRFALPDLPTLLNGVAGPVGMPQTTFLQDLTGLWEQYAAWVQSEGRDPLHAGETSKERRARIARESMARTRARRAGTNPELSAKLEEVRRLHAAYLEACRARKDAIAVHDEDVRCAWAAYELARDAAKG
jgi:hypothetical protein